MNPNSKNQIWSKWGIFVTPGRTLQRPFGEFKLLTAKKLREIFGSASQCRITETYRGYLVEVLSEGKPIQDKDYIKNVGIELSKFYKGMLGIDTRVQMTAKLMAGSPQTGVPDAQLLIIPGIQIVGADELVNIKRETKEKYNG